MPASSPMPQPGPTAQPNAVPSPIATGGAGEDFERRLAALALTLLLARAQAPVLLNAVVSEVHLQTRHLGWCTDDILLVGEIGPGIRRKLAIQAKRTFSVSASDQECVATITGMWDDFSDSQRFDSTNDRLAIATLHGTSTLLRDFTSLLMCARAASDASDFRRRIGPGTYLPKKAISQHDAIWSILKSHLNTDPDRDQFWRFLRALTVLSYDLGTESAQSEAMALSLLSFIAVDVSDPATVARATWAELLDIASSGRQAAQSFKRDQLPASLRELHRAVSSEEEQARRDLVAHGRTVREIIRSTISRSFTIERAALLDALLTAVKDVPVTVVVGAAGSGKSALAKAMLDHVEKERPVFAFQAVEFATPHLNDTLVRTQTGVTVRTLPALLAAHDRTTILIESIERLLEHSTRDAFAQLVQLLATVPSVRLVLTCRDYSLDTVRSALLESYTVTHTVIEVPPLTDIEVAAAAESVSALARPLSEPRMRSFLRTPYLLDLASRLNWEDASLPDSLRAFRERCWREIVRNEANRVNGMPSRRELAFLSVAQRRAAELRSYVRPTVSDPEAIDALVGDSLLQAAPGTTGHYAPAHDVLEDWAIIKWLDNLAADTDDPATTLASSVGGYPALRRGVRRWLSERLSADPTNTCNFILAAGARADLPSYFRDDCVVSALLSDAAPAFVDGCRSRVAEGDTELLRQLVHLLSVACKSPPTWLPQTSLQSELLVPVGPAWEPVLDLVCEHLPTQPNGDALLFLSLIEDWSKAINISSPTPRGAPSAGRIASHLLPLFDEYNFSKARKRTLGIILKIPRYSPAFTDLAQRAKIRGRDDRIAREFTDLAVSTLSSPFLARDFPDAITAILRAHLLVQVSNRAAASDSLSLDVNEAFGFHESIRNDFFPASAHQGPFNALLRHHPSAAVDFILELANHAGTCYGERRWSGNDLEPARLIELDVPDTGLVHQWANWRLYALFRGMSVGPYALKCALMALEQWLLHIGTLDGVDLESWLLHILRSSNSVISTGVVASVCTAHPVRAGRATLALLSSRELIYFDRVRMASESTSATGVFSGINPSNRWYEDERRESNALSHRNEDLESLAIRAQLSPLKEDVWAIIDRHRSEISESDEEAQLWRLALHRMDIRGFRVAAQEPHSAVDESVGPRVVAVEPGSLEPDLQDLVADSSERMRVLSRHMRLRRDSEAAWERTVGTSLNEWKSLLASARSLAPEERLVEAFARGGTGITAAVGIRDHLPSLDAGELSWCIEEVLRALGGATEDLDYGDRHGRLFGPDRAAAAVLPILVAHAQERLPADFIELLAEALTHQVHEIADYAFYGVGSFLGREHDQLVLRCAAAAARVAQRREALREMGVAAEQHLIAPDRAQALAAGGMIRSSDAGDETAIAHAALLEDAESATEAIAKIDLHTWDGRKAASRALTVLARRADLSITQTLAAGVAQWLAETWGRRRHERTQTTSDFEGAFDLCQQLARLVLALPPDIALETCAPLIALGPDEPHEVEKFVGDLVIAVDESLDRGAREVFWLLWQNFADAALGALAGGWPDQDRPKETPLIDRLFLSQPWKPSATRWVHLDGHAFRVHSLAERIPAAAAFVRAYARFLYTVGRQELPNAFVSFDSLVRRGDAIQLMADADIAFCIETLLGQFVYAQPARLKSEPALRDAVLRLLDALVVAGSAAAYRMRDDFVTPLHFGG